MYCNSCEQNPCTCRKPSTRPVRETASVYGPGITKEQFGVNLYDVVKTLGGILALDDHIEQSKLRGEGFRIQGFTQRRDVLRKELARLLPTLTDDEMEQVVARYPLVVGL